MFQTTIRAEIAAAAQVLQSPAEVDDAVDADLEDKVKNDTVAAPVKPATAHAANGNGAAASAPAKKGDSGEVAFASKHAHKAKKVKL